MSEYMGYRTEGTSALKPESAPRFRVYQGGASEGVAPARHASRARSLSLPVMVVVIAVLVTLGASAVDSARRSSTERLLATAPQETVSVESGDTLWSIAQGHAVKGADTQSVVSWIMATNGLSSPSLSVGESLVVPVLQK